jgi:hypothetical protein
MRPRPAPWAVKCGPVHPPCGPGPPSVHKSLSSSVPQFTSPMRPRPAPWAVGPSTHLAAQARHQALHARAVRRLAAARRPDDHLPERAHCGGGRGGAGAAAACGWQRWCSGSSWPAGASPSRVGAPAAELVRPPQPPSSSTRPLCSCPALHAVHCSSPPPPRLHSPTLSIPDQPQVFNRKQWPVVAPPRRAAPSAPRDSARCTRQRPSSAPGPSTSPRASGRTRRASRGAARRASGRPGMPRPTPLHRTSRGPARRSTRAWSQSRGAPSSTGSRPSTTR